MEPIPETSDVGSRESEMDVVSSVHRFLSYAFMNIALRVLMIKDKRGEFQPWFVGKDICDVLKLSNVSDSLKRLDDDEKAIEKVDTPGGIQKVSIINEFGLYSLIRSSRKKEARVFQRWVNHEVLPSLRKYGVYATDPTIAAIQRNPALIQNMLSDVEKHKQQARAYEIELKNKQETIDNYPVAMFLKEETKRVDVLAELSSEMSASNIKYLDVYNTCYVRVLNKTVQIDGIGKRVIFKFGTSNHISNRVKKHKREYKNSRLLQLYITTNGVEVEREFKRFLTINKLQFSMKLEENGPNHKELFYTTPECNIGKVLSAFQNMCLPHHPISVYEAKIAQLEIELNNANTNLTELKREYRNKSDSYRQTAATLTILREKHSKMKEELRGLEKVEASLRSMNDSLKYNNDKILNTILNKVSQIGNTDSSSSSKSSKSSKRDSNPLNLRICVICNAPCALDQFGKWPTGNDHHECNACFELLKPDTIIESESDELFVNVCTYCGIEKPLNYFYSELNTCRNTCKRCISNQKKAKTRMNDFDRYYKQHEQKVKLEQTQSKKCTKCHQLKKLNEYYKCQLKDKPEGEYTYNERCITCVAKINADRYEKKKELKSTKTDITNNNEDNSTAEVHKS